MTQNDQNDQTKCPHCGGNYTEELTMGEWECYDCGDLFTVTNRINGGEGEWEYYDCADGSIFSNGVLYTTAENLASTLSAVGG